MMSALCCTLIITAAPSDAAMVCAELGVPPLAGRFAPLAADYLPDEISTAQILYAPGRHPLRSAVLKAAEANSAALKLRPIFDVRQSNLEPAKRAVLDFQRPLAAAILNLNEASQELSRAAAHKDGEPSLRWRTHFDYLDAAIRLRIGMLEELNLSYGRLHRSELPEINSAARHNGWRLAPADAMISKGMVRRLAEDARDELADFAKAHAGSPWAALAERELALKPGLAWHSASVPAPQPPRPDPRRRR